MVGPLGATRAEQLGESCVGYGIAPSGHGCMYGIPSAPRSSRGVLSCSRW